MIEGEQVPPMAQLPITDLQSGVEVLRAARALIMRQGWSGSRAHALDRHGRECAVTSARAIRFGVGAAIVRARNELGLCVWAGINAQRILARATLQTPPELNRSCRRESDVIEAFDRALKTATKLEANHGKEATAPAR